MANGLELTEEQAIRDAVERQIRNAEDVAKQIALTGKRHCPSCTHRETTYRGKCRQPLAGQQWFNPVTGEGGTVWMRAEKMREPGSPCGPRGLLWEPTTLKAKATKAGVKYGFVALCVTGALSPFWLVLLVGYALDKF